MNRVCKLSVLALVILAALWGCASAQQAKEMAVVRGHFSIGDDVWKAQDFGWFYYDVDDDTGGETLSIDVNGRVAEKGHIVYSSKAWSENFEYEPWGTYQAVAFLRKHYLAGYPESDLTNEVSSLEKGYLREVLIDDDEIHGLSYNTTLPLLGSYVLALNEISKSNEEASLVLLKSGKPVDVAVVSEGQTYVFKVEDIPVIMVHVSNIMRSEDGGIVEVNGVFQIGEIPEFVLSEGDQLDNMEVTDISDQGIELKNNKSLSLRKDSLVSLVDGLMITVANIDSLLYYPIGIITDYGYHEIRGPVFSANSLVKTSLGQYAIDAEARWDPSNFGGFYFDPEKMNGDETFLIFNTVDRTIPSFRNKIENETLLADGLQYMSSVQTRAFEYESWGKYRMISLYGQPWFVGYGPEASPQIDRKDLLEQDYLSQVLIDSDESNEAVAGNVFRLDEDYNFIIGDVGNDSILVQLQRGGKPVDTSVVRSNTTYVYKRDLGDLDDVPLIILHVQNIFSSNDEKLAIIDGIFQISESTIPVEESLDLGETTIALSNSQIVVIVNPEKINLNRDFSINLWPGLGLRVADNDTLRYYPYTVEYVIPKPSLPQEINYPRNITSLSQANFTMVVQAAEITEVIAEILDSSGNTVYSRDLTRSGMGSGDIWLYGWSWNASVLSLSDDESRIMDTSFAPALLYQNASTLPVQVGVRLDGQGKIASILNSKVLYYISPEEYGKLNASQDYDSMIANQTARSDYIKIVPGESLLRFIESINDSTILSDKNHTITGSLASLEPHAIRVAAPPGKYELRVRIENPANALRVTGAYIDVTAPARQSQPAEQGEIQTHESDVETEVEKSNALTFATALAALAAAFFLRPGRRRP